MYPCPTLASVNCESSERERESFKVLVVHLYRQSHLNNFVILDMTSILFPSFSGGNCIRCLHIRLRSRNVIQILTEGLGACYTTDEAAEASCPKDNALEEFNNKDKSILLYSKF